MKIPPISIKDELKHANRHVNWIHRSTGYALSVDSCDQGINTQSQINRSDPLIGQTGKTNRNGQKSADGDIIERNVTNKSTQRATVQQKQPNDQ